MKSIQSKIYLLLFILMSINAIAQNSLFEKVFQNGYANYDVKILKRDTTGFAVFTESIGAVASPFGSANTVFTCNDTGFVIKKNLIRFNHSNVGRKVRNFGLASYNQWKLFGKLFWQRLRFWFSRLKLNI